MSLHKFPCSFILIKNKALTKYKQYNKFNKQIHIRTNTNVVWLRSAGLNNFYLFNLYEEVNDKKQYSNYMLDEPT